MQEIYCIKRLMSTISCILGRTVERNDFRGQKGTKCEALECCRIGFGRRNLQNPRSRFVAPRARSKRRAPILANRAFLSTTSSFWMKKGWRNASYGAFARLASLRGIAKLVDRAFSLCGGEASAFPRCGVLRPVRDAALPLGSAISSIVLPIQQIPNTDSMEYNTRSKHKNCQSESWIPVVLCRSWQSFSMAYRRLSVIAESTPR